MYTVQYSTYVLYCIIFVAIARVGINVGIDIIFNAYAFLSAAVPFATGFNTWCVFAYAIVVGIVFHTDTFGSIPRCVFQGAVVFCTIWCNAGVSVVCVTDAG